VKVKNAIAVVLGAACIAVPAFALGSHNGGGGGGGSGSGSVQFTGTPEVNCDFWFLGTGEFDHWVNVPGSRIEQLQFGGGHNSNPDPDHDGLGVRMVQTTPGNQLPASTTNTFQLDWNLTNRNDPRILLIITDPRGGNGDFYVNFVSPFSNIFQRQTLSNGFTRITYNGVADRIAPGSTISELDFMDFCGAGTSFNEQIENIFVNGHPTSANLHAPTNPPQYNTNFSL
jgi:hypothetical protein